MKEMVGMVRLRSLPFRLLTALLIGAAMLNLAPMMLRPEPVAAAAGAPLLVVVNSTSSPYSNYLQEILNAEGVKDYEVRSLSTVSSTVLTGRRGVLLGETALTSAQATMFDNFVNAGGGLVAMRPDALLNTTLGVTRQGTTTAEGYMRITDPTLGAGLYGNTMQFHGTSSQYTLGSATQIAELYSNRTTSVGRPAVTLANRGSGKAAMFSYDLARSVAQTRQGNPASGNVDVDGDGLFRTIDLYRNWADLERANVPQADMQQRLLVRLLEAVMVQPVPRLWYFPNSAKSVLVVTGDAHSNPDSYYQNEISALQQVGATATFYMAPAGNPSAAQVAAWRAQGFDFAPHPYIDCGYDCGYDAAFNWFQNTYGFAPRTTRTHQVRWSGWTTAASIEADHGVGLDFNTYQWGSWLEKADGTPALGYLNGSGLPMRYIDTGGNLLPIYQQHTVLVDEELAPQAGERGLSLAEAVAASRQVIDDSLNGNYAPITTQYHVDYFYPNNSDWAIQTAEYAIGQGIPSLTADTWLEFVQDRAATVITNTAWTGSNLTFTVSASTAGQRMLVPVQYGNRVLSGVTVGSSAASYTTTNINGTQFALVNVQNGNYTASYAVDTTAPTVVGNSPTNGATGVSTSTTVGVTFSEAMNRTATQAAFSISPNVAGTFAWNGTGTSLTFTPGTTLTPSTSYTATVSTTASDLAGNTIASPRVWSFTTGAVTPPPAIGGVSPISGPIAGGTGVTIGGSGFTSATAVSFGGAAATSFTVNNDTTITAVAPPRAAGTVDITVTTPVGTSAIVAADRYTYIDQTGAITVTSVDPATGSTAGGGVVTIRGANFATGATVRFGGTAATGVTVTSTTTITATVPARAAGTIDVQVTNPNTQSATLAGGYTYVTCPSNCLTQTTVGDFGGGTLGTGTSVAQTADGEVQLAPAAGAEFGGTTLPSGWTAAPWSTGGGATVANGTLTVDGALVTTNDYATPSRVLEFVATFNSTTPFQHIGFGTDLNSAPWAIFSTGFTGGALYARTNNGAGQTDTAISGNWLGAPHRYRIEWSSTSLTYFIDGSQVASHPIAITGGMRPVISDGGPGNGAVGVDWLRLTPYAPSGVFTSRVLDAAGSATWGIVAWSATVPSGTSLAVSVRRGNTPAPDSTWTAFAPFTSGGSVGGSSRYLQYQVSLATTTSGQTPVLRDIIFGYTVSGPLSPTMTGANPASAPTAGGTTVALTGTNFATGATVTLGGVAATNVNVANSTSLTLTTPAHAAGSVDIVVTNPGGANGVLTNGFTYVAAPPVLGSVSPASGPSVGGTTVTLTGSDLAGASTVSFGGTAASSFTVNSGTSITATAPAHAVGTVNVTVTTPAGTSAAGTGNQYTYQQSAPTPQVGQVSPGTGTTAGGVTVTIGGQNFVGVTGVTFGGTAAAYTVHSSTSLSATVPAHAAGAVDVRVTTATGTSATNATARYTYVSCPSGCQTQTTVTDFASGTVGAGAYLAQTGDGEVQLAPAAGAEFGGTTLPNDWTAAPWSAGGTASFASGNLVVDGALVVTEDYFGPGRALEFVATFDPAAPFQHAGLGLDLNGVPWAIFSTGASGGALYARSNGGAQFDTLLPGDWLGAPHRFRIAWTAAGLTYAIDGVEVASHATGNTGAMRPVLSDGPVGGGALRLDWLRLGPAAASGSFTSRALDAGGAATWDTIAWSGDQPGGTSVAISVRTGNTPTPDATWGSFAPVSNGAAVGMTGRYLQYEATLTTSDPELTSTLADLLIGYTITGLPAPTITGLLPASGSTAGGTTVTIGGTGFTGASAVSFGGAAAASFTVNGDASITAIAPAHAVGIVDVIVTAPGGATAASAASKFTYQSAAPTVTSISPATGPASGGTSVTLIGGGLAGASGVSFGGTAASSFTVNSDASITAVAPAHAAGTVNVTVTTPAGTSAASAANQYQFLPPGPGVAQLSPAIGPATGGTVVTIRGTHFTGATAVTFGGTAAANFTVTTDSTITATAPSRAPGTVDVRVTAPTGTSAPNSAARFTYVACPDGCITQTAAAQFAAGTQSGTYVGQNGDGEVQLAPTLGLEFAGSVLPTGLTATPWSAGGGATVVGGALTVDGALVVTEDYFGPGRALEFVATFDPAAPFQHAGLGLDLNGVPWAIFSTGASGGALYARSNGGAQFDTLLPGDWLGAPHRFRIAWTAAGLTYAIDGVEVASHATGNTGAMRPVLSDGPVGGGALRLDWLRLGPAATSGSFTSPVFDAGNTATWGAVAWTGELPVGTTLTIAVRAGDSPTPDATWDAFTPVSNGDISGKTGRYLQYQTTLTTSDPSLTPTLADFNIGYTIGAALPPPTVTSLSPTTGPAVGGTTVAITGTDFNDALAVTFGSTPATSYTVDSATTITAIAPPGTGTVDVTVATRFGTSPATSASRYAYAVAPTVQSISPAAGPAAGGTTVTITGANYASGATVTFDGVAATVGAATATTLIVTTPPHAAGAVTVVVTNPDGQTDTVAAGFTYVAAPTVASVTPNAGPLAGGATATIGGTNFAQGVTVTFGGVAATDVVVASATSLTATIPARGAGAVMVTVTNADGQNGSLNNGYTYHAAPTATGITPSSGPTAGGTAVTITGTDFVAGATTVTFGGVAGANVTVQSATSLTVQTPPNAAGPAPVVVTTPGGETAAVQFTFVPPPTITDVSPNSGPLTGGTAVTITGTDFAGATAVTFGGSAATNIVVVNATTITATSPAGSVGTVDIVVTTPSGTGTTPQAGRFTYLAPPAVTSLTPTTGPSVGGTTVTITGTGFLSGATVTFGGTAATNVTVVNATTITARTPARPVGAATVAVTNANGLSGSLANAFTYVGAPTVTGVTPNSGPTTGGNTVTIGGTNFLAGATVTFDGAAATNVVVTSLTSLTATAPAQSSGGANIVVTNAGGQSGTLSNGYTYRSRPTILLITPGSGPIAGNTQVTIFGSNFVSGGTTVTFDGLEGTSVTVQSTSQLSVRTPAHAAGDVALVVTTTGGSSVADEFTYIAPAPVITEVTPNSGPLGGGTTVTITGTNFTGANRVRFGANSAASFTVVSATTITAVTPSGSAGSVTVDVRTASGTGTAPTAENFVYLNAPTVSAVSPSSGPASGGTIVTISGSNISGATAVAFGTTNAPNFTYINNGTQIRVTAPARPNGATGLVAVRVTTPGGTSTATVSSQNDFTYTASGNLAPTIAAEHRAAPQLLARRRQEDDSAAPTGRRARRDANEV